MTTHADHRTWQDVYHGQWIDGALYIKFQRAGEYFVVSFKDWTVPSSPVAFMPPCARYQVAGHGDDICA